MYLDYATSSTQANIQKVTWVEWTKDQYIYIYVFKHSTQPLLAQKRLSELSKRIKTYTYMSDTYIKKINLKKINLS